VPHDYASEWYRSVPNRAALAAPVAVPVPSRAETTTRAHTPYPHAPARTSIPSPHAAVRPRNRPLTRSTSVRVS